MKNLSTQSFLKFLKKLKLSRKLAVVVIRFYQMTLSTIFGGRCRYYPSCSHYAIEAYEIHTFKRATWLVMNRFFSCHPLSRKPTFDPVPTIDTEMS